MIELIDLSKIATKKAKTISKKHKKLCYKTWLQLLDVQHLEGLNLTDKKAIQRVKKILSNRIETYLRENKRNAILIQYRKSDINKN